MLTLDRSISMVHARAFSFTDDSTSVAFPIMSSVSAPVGHRNSGMIGPHSLEGAKLLFQLRRAQSNWYQELFQSSRDPLQQSSTYIWEMCREMRVWSESFSESLSPAFREHFELELLYSYVYCLAPSCRVTAVSEIGKTLIFEYSISYMGKIHPIAQGPVNTAFYSYHDALRVYFIGSQFLAVLSANLDHLLNGIVPYTAPLAGGPPPPPIPNIGRTDNLERSIRCIEQIIETLKIYGERWEDPKALQASFEGQAGGITAELYRRRQQQEMRARSSTSPSNSSQSHLSPNHVENMRNDDWSSTSYTATNGNMVQRHHASTGSIRPDPRDHPGLSRNSGSTGSIRQDQRY
jgi:hypothetical protein